MTLMLTLATLLAGCSIIGDDGGQITGDQVIADQNGGSIPGEGAQSPSGGGDEPTEGVQATFETDTDGNSDDGDGSSDGNSESSGISGSSASGKSGSDGGGSGSGGGNSDGNGSDGSDDSDGSGPAPDTDFCEAPTRVSHEIKFARGASSKTVSETAEPGEVDRFRLESGADQIMTISLASADPAIVATLMQPDGRVLPNSFVDKRINSTQAGDYHICVNPGQAVIGYQLRVSIVDSELPSESRSTNWCGEVVQERGEIRFASGASSGSVRQTVVRGDRDLYRLDASAGQFMEVQLTSTDDTAVFALQSPSGLILTREAPDLRTLLPETGSYRFCVGGTAGNATYTLNVFIE